MKEKRQFSIFNSHLDLAHQYWQKLIQKGDWAIDATCGNGHDTLFLSKICEGVIGIDIQEAAIKNTQRALGDSKNVFLFCQSHENFPNLALEKNIRLVVYNLGYLPGGEKNITTATEKTLKSIRGALNLIESKGCVSITCYPGHPEGALEEKALRSYLKDLDSQNWSVCFHEWMNRAHSPSLFLIQKN